MVKFIDIHIEGFGSYITRKKFKLHRPGLNIVIAANGSGKSTTFSALTWVISGTPLKKTKSVTTWPQSQPKGFLGTYVELNFRKDQDLYTIIRLKDYKGKVNGTKGKDRLIIMKGEEVLRFGNKIETQKAIYSILGFNEEILMNTLVFGQRMRRLIETSGPEKKRVFEEAFSAGFLNQAYEKAKSDYQDKIKELTPLTTGLTAIEFNVRLSKEKLTNEREKRDTWKSNQQNRLKAERQSLKSKKEQLERDTKDTQDTDNPGLEKLLKELTRDGSMNDTQKSEAKAKLDRVSTNLRDAENEVTLKDSKGKEDIARAEKAYKAYGKGFICATCGTVLDKEDPKQKEKLKAEIEKATKAAKITQQSLTTITQGLQKDYDKAYKAWDDLKTIGRAIDADKLSITNQIKAYEYTELLNKRTIDDIKDLKNKIKEIKADKPKGIAKNIRELKKTYLNYKQALKEEKPKVKRLTQEVEDLKWVINDLLSNKGLKAFIFDTMLEKLNDKLRYYEQFIDYRVEFRVDLEGGNKDIYAICYHEDNIVYYEDLSGGEKQKVDAVTAFALHDLISTKTPSNLLVFDEPFEGLDQANIEVVSELINEKSRGRSVFLVTHQLDMQNSSNKVIRMSKNKKGDTTLKVL